MSLERIFKTKEVLEFVRENTVEYTSLMVEDMSDLVGEAPPVLRKRTLTIPNLRTDGKRKELYYQPLRNGQREFVSVGKVGEFVVVGLNEYVSAYREEEEGKRRVRVYKVGELSSEERQRLVEIEGLKIGRFLSLLLYYPRDSAFVKIDGFESWTRNSFLGNKVKPALATALKSRTEPDAPLVMRLSVVMEQSMDKKVDYPTFKLEDVGVGEALSRELLHDLRVVAQYYRDKFYKTEASPLTVLYRDSIEEVEDLED